MRGEVARYKGMCWQGGGGCCGIDDEMCMLERITWNCWGGSVHSDAKKRVRWAGDEIGRS